MVFLLRNIILTIFTLFFIAWNALAASQAISAYETQIFSESKKEKIEKLQTVFKNLNLYSGPIDGVYTSIERDLLAYQIKNWLAINKNSYGAGYFGVKTFKKMEAEYGDVFTKLADLHLQKEQIALWDRYFMVTAYYSPLPWQARYTTGSYAGDKRLNGNGTHAASGKQVFPGLLAAPRNYDFWTKIFLEGIGVGSVEDRWWAIVNAGERGYSEDRIDIWMWSGDEGLERALKWGKRRVKWEIVELSESVSVVFNSSPVEKYRKLKIDAENPERESVKKLQTLFTQIGLYTWPISGEFEDIRPILVDFQVKQEVITNKDSYVAGYVGEKTIQALRREYGSQWIFRQPEELTLENIAISDLRRKQLIKIGDILNTKIDKKYRKNTVQNNNYRKKLHSILEKAIIKTKKTKRKNDFRYLKIYLKK